MELITIGNVVGSPGQVKKGSLGSLYLSDGTAINIPIFVVQGAKPGPVLWVSAAMHGQELGGIGVVWELVHNRLDPQLLRGTVVASPLLNPLSFTGGTYFTPQDGYNINRVFPGSASGLLTQRLADLIYREGLQKCDYVIDFHANPDPALHFTIIKESDDRETWQKSKAMAQAFGVTVIEMEMRYEAHRTGTLVEAVLALGKPAVIVELTPWRRITPEAVQVGARGVLNVMKHLDMLDGEPESQAGIQILEGTLTRTEITATRGGLVKQYKTVGDPVTEGEVVGHIVDVYGEEVEPIVSPVDGWLMAFPLLDNQAAGSGDFLAFFAFPKT